MTDTLAIARRLYDGFAARDPRAILAALTEDFAGQVSAGMPLDVGGAPRRARGDAARGLGPVFAAYDLSVDAECYLPSGEDTVVVLGHYRGAERATARPVDARFAHVLTVRDGRVAALEQITDTRAWTG